MKLYPRVLQAKPKKNSFFRLLAVGISGESKNTCTLAFLACGSSQFAKAQSDLGINCGGSLWIDKGMLTLGMDRDSSETEA